MEADFDVSDFEQSKQRELDKNLLVKFFYKNRPDSTATEEAGRPMFKEVEYIDIKIAGDRNSGVCRPARTTDIQRFKAHYEAFKNRVEAPVTGTPLTECTFIPRTIVEELSFQNVKTVEQLAALSDDFAGRMHGGYGFKRKAQDYLDQAKAVAEFESLSELKKQNSELKESNSALLARLESLEEKINAKPAQVKKTLSKEALAKMAAGRAKAAANRKEKSKKG